MKKKLKILAIESSFDETAASVIEAFLGDTPEFTTLSSNISSQSMRHAEYGGGVPELAARLHIDNIEKVVDKALTDAGVAKKDLTHMAVTSGPGLVPALVVGVEYAKGLALALDIPLIETNHMAGHLFSCLADKKQFEFPIVSLVVSGGHTQLWLMNDYHNYSLLGETVDDAAGEAFDKVGRLLGLAYPGGPKISMLALQSPAPIDFPRPMMNSGDYNFSFSGLKTAVRIYVQKNLPTTNIDKANIAKGFEDACVDVLTHKLFLAAKQYNAKTVAIGGGVSANRKLRKKIESEAEIKNLTTLIPPLSICTDNAEMIAIAAYFDLLSNKKIKPAENIIADPNWEIK